MSDEGKPKRGNTGEGDYRVGYGRPPLDTRFKPGVSGNPRGRPRGTKNLNTLLDKIMSRCVTITERGTPRRVPYMEALLLKISHQALSGDHRATRMILDFANRLSVPADPPFAIQCDKARQSIREKIARLLSAAKDELQQETNSERP
jgi:hypothetical protein